MSQETARTKNRWILLAAPATLLLLTVFIIHTMVRTEASDIPAGRHVARTATYTFEKPSVLEESPAPEMSAHEELWLNSGGMFSIENGVGKTVQKALPDRHPWRSAYKQSSPIITDEGRYPQNIFRLITRTQWRTFSQEIRFAIQDMSRVPSIDQTIPSDVSLFLRQQDNDNLYYAGIRTNGTLSIKKKLDGVYYKLRHQPFLVTPPDEERQTALPIHQWIRMGAIIYDMHDQVFIVLRIDHNDDGIWDRAVIAKDRPDIGGAVIQKSGHAGVRSDYLDVFFDDYTLREFSLFSPFAF